MIRRYGPPPRPVRHRLRPGAYAVILDGRGGALLTEQDDPSVGPPELQLPGGGIDPGESPLRALHREVLEETGHRIRVLRRLGAFRRFTWMPEYGIHAEKLCHVYLCRPGPRIGPPSEPGHRALTVPARLAAARLGNEGDRALLGAAIGSPGAAGQVEAGRAGSGRAKAASSAISTMSAKLDCRSSGGSASSVRR
jgi:8-oxo-dGTP diphosphatase